ncbi:MAG: hypothetical protein PF569_09985 [Candidatus Woesearchaeota archaeon]|jgi:hypothetical protein|nr:hypothetical protein [Candidatus Woesearchaeota archaeon]
MKHHKTITKKLDDEFPWNKKTIGHFFLGVGFIMFVLNTTTILNLIQIEEIAIPMIGYYTSTLSSLFLMGYSLYNIYSED